MMSFAKLGLLNLLIVLVLIVESVRGATYSVEVNLPDQYQNVQVRNLDEPELVAFDYSLPVVAEAQPDYLVVDDAVPEVLVVEEKQDVKIAPENFNQIKPDARDGDREEISTTPRAPSCPFCGVNRVNPPYYPSFPSPGANNDGNNNNGNPNNGFKGQINPDSEPVEPTPGNNDAPNNNGVPTTFPQGGVVPRFLPIPNLVSGVVYTPLTGYYVISS